ncbi:MAG TPA: DNA methyltransferase, partial [Gemmatimonadaceae bacterium]
MRFRSVSTCVWCENDGTRIRANVARGYRWRLMRLSWNEIRARAGAFAEEWRDASYERGETQSFYNAFLEIFAINRRRVATFEEPVKRLGDRQGFIDLFWKGVLLVEQKSAGRSLKRAREQALEYFPGLKPAELPRYVLLCDFQTFELMDLETGEETHFRLADLSDYVERFGFIVGVERRVFRDQDPVNIDAAEIMGTLHDALKDSGYDGHPLERFLVRILFCLFADDTGIFERGTLEDYLTSRTREDGSDLGTTLAGLFQTLNTPEDKRQAALDDDLARFPYINGELFAETLRFPAFTATMRARLLEACAFNWEKISPAIFGALFQSVMSPLQRRAQGAHYTTEKNILKVIEPLFLDDLRVEFERVKRLKRDKATALRALQSALSSLTFFDPACGCGNFLIIAYRELRALELDVLTVLHSVEQFDLDATSLSRVDVDQFYGIEIDEFPVRIAEVAMWMMDHIMNNRLSLKFGTVFARIPLKAAPHITHADALETDWTGVLAPNKCSFVMGNPPFVGAKMQSAMQRAQVRRIASLGGSGGTLDYVTAWFLKAGEYLRNSHARVAFVATNSITQGEQVAQLWPLLFDRYSLEITFAHRTFAWGSDARGKAHVHVVIIGLARRGDEPAEKRLFTYDKGTDEATEARYRVLSPYLFDASALANPHLVVRETSHALGGAPKIIIGTKPIDGGYYIFDAAERTAFLGKQPDAADLLHPFVGSEEYINGSERWILVLDGVQPERIRALPEVYALVQLVRGYRLGEIAAKRKAVGDVKQPGTSSRQLADTPTRFHVTVIPTDPFLCVPEVSSERRDYVPIGWLEPPTIPSNLLRVILNAEPWRFA